MALRVGAEFGASFTVRRNDALAVAPFASVTMTVIVEVPICAGVSCEVRSAPLLSNAVTVIVADPL